MPDLLAPSTSYGEEGMKIWGMVAPFLPLRIVHSACPEVPARVRRSGRQGVGRGTIVPFTTPPDTLFLLGPAHEVATLGWIRVYLASVPVPQSGLPAEQTAAVPGVSPYNTATCGHAK